MSLGMEAGVTLGSAGILPALAGILPDRLKTKSRVNVVSAGEPNNAFRPAGMMPAGAVWKPALPKHVII